MKRNNAPFVKGYLVIIFAFFGICVLSGCETTKASGRGVGDIGQCVSKKVIEKNGLGIRWGNLYDSARTRECYGKDFKDIGIIPIVLSITNLSAEDRIIIFSKSSLSADGLSNAKPLIVRHIMERIEDDVYGTVLINAITMGLTGLAKAADDAGRIAIRNERTEDLIIKDKIDPLVTLKAHESIDGILFFDAETTDIAGKKVIIKKLDQPTLTLIVKDAVGNAIDIAVG